MLTCERTSVMNLENAIRSEAVTDVLLLYNLDTFLSDSSLADVLNTGT